MLLFGGSELTWSCFWFCPESQLCGLFLNDHHWTSRRILNDHHWTGRRLLQVHKGGTRVPWETTLPQDASKAPTPQIWRKAHLLTLHCFLITWYLSGPGVLWSCGLGCFCNRFQQDHEIWPPTRRVWGRPDQEPELSSVVQFWDRLGLRRPGPLLRLRHRQLSWGDVMRCAGHWSRALWPCRPPCNSKTSGLVQASVSLSTLTSQECGEARSKEIMDLNFSAVKPWVWVRVFRCL